MSVTELAMMVPVTDELLADSVLPVWSLLARLTLDRLNAELFGESQVPVMALIERSAWIWDAYVLNDDCECD